MRYFVPVVFFAAAAYVWWFNDTHTNEWLLVPFLDAIDSLRGDRDAQALWSWRILAGLGVLLLVWTIFGDLRSKNQRSKKKSSG